MQQGGGEGLAETAAQLAAKTPRAPAHTQAHKLTIAEHRESGIRCPFLAGPGVSGGEGGNSTYEPRCGILLLSLFPPSATRSTAQAASPPSLPTWTLKAFPAWPSEQLSTRLVVGHWPRARHLADTTSPATYDPSVPPPCVAMRNNTSVGKHFPRGAEVRPACTARIVGKQRRERSDVAPTPVGRRQEDSRAQTKGWTRWAAEWYSEQQRPIGSSTQENGIENSCGVEWKQRC